MTSHSESEQTSSDSFISESSGNESSRRSKRKRRVSPSLDSAISFPRKVSLWNRDHAVHHAHIAYAKKYLPDFESLKPYIHGQIHEFSQVQDSYVEFLEEFVTFNIYEQDFLRNAVYKASVEEQLSIIENKLEKSTGLDPKFEINIRKFLRDLRSVHRSINQMDKKEKCRLENIPAGKLVRLIGCFAELCLLQIEYCNEADQASMNLNGKTVHSKPDIRLYSTQSGYDGSPASVLSIAEVNKRDQRDSPIGPPRKRYLGSLSDDDEDEAIPADVVDLMVHDRVLGQHAGELLLDLNLKYRTRNANDFTDDQKISMLGMIAQGTFINFTVLEMTWKHYQKLKCGLPLGIEDQATIYYCESKTFLGEFTRRPLIKDFMTLNNIEYI